MHLNILDVFPCLAITILMFTCTGRLKWSPRCSRLEAANVTSYGQRGFYRHILSWEDYPGLSRWFQCNHRVLIRRGGRAKEEAMWRWKQRWECWTLKMEECKDWNLKLQKARKQVVPLESPEATNSGHTYCSPVTLISDFWSPEQ